MKPVKITIVSLFLGVHGLLFADLPTSSGSPASPAATAVVPTAAAPAAAEAAAPAPLKAEAAKDSSLPTCCQKAAKKGKACEMPCCVAAAKEGKVCEKCLAKKTRSKRSKAKEEGQTTAVAPVPAP